MKRFLLLALLMVSVILVNGQTGQFKTKVKNQSVATAPGFHYNQVHGKTSLKSTTSGSFKVSPRLLPLSGAKSDGDIKKVIMRENGPVYIEKKTSSLKSAGTLSNEERLRSFLESTRSFTHMSDRSVSFEITSAHTDQLGIQHIRTVQRYKGIRIYGSESILHADNETERYTGSFQTIEKDIPLTVVYSAQDALKAVKEDLKKTTVYRDLSGKEKELLKYDLPKCEQVIYRQPDKTHVLAWEIEIRPNIIEHWKYFIHAQTGKIILKFNMTASDGPATATAVDLNGITRTIDTYLQEGTYYLIDAKEDMFNATTEDGMIITMDANNTSTTDLNYTYVTSNNNTWNHPAAISAHYNATATYRYFSETFGRNSLNNQGGSILSFVNVTEDDGSSMENAFWNGQAAFYGNGGIRFESLAAALDVTAHELGHGVVSNTANLEYMGQSGAINESFADIFGSMVDREDWEIGEDITKTSYSPSGALRNMQDPHNSGTSANPYWQPMSISEMYIGDKDNGGVHINSGIGNHAYYLFATAVTKQKAEQVYYRALTEYLTKASQFIDLRIAVVQAAKDLYGESSTEVVKAGEAFDAVGIREEDPVDYQQDYPVNPGQDYLLSYNTDPAYEGTLYRTSVTGTNFEELTITPMKGKVSVQDDGTAAVFVSTDHTIQAIYLDDPFPEQLISAEDFGWDNVALSKDGNRLAAISRLVDTAIYVYDFGLEEWAKFTLYNPTTSDENINAGGVLYADAIEFDHTGEYIMYDSYNELNSNTDEDISYWDIGFIKVWDSQTGDFGDGSVSKLFGSLPEGVSVGNPVFSKNSPYIIAFDYWDQNTDNYVIYGANLLTGDLEVIRENNTLGYPTYSKLDDKIGFTVLDENNDEMVASIDLAPDKITGVANSEQGLVGMAKWSVFYATGTRSLGLAPVSNFTADVKSGAAPLQVQFLDQSLNNPTSWTWTFQGGSPATSNLQNPVVTYGTPGVYQVSLVSNNSFGNNTASKTSYIEVTAATGLVESEEFLVSFYPNPATSVLNISCEKDFSVKLFNLQGELVLSRFNEKQLDISGLKTGLYFIEIKVGNTLLKNKILKY